MPSNDSHVGPISVTLPQVLDHLRDHDFVYTARQKRTTGNTWLRFGRLDGKRAEVTIAHEQEITTWDDLDKSPRKDSVTSYTEASGFNSTQEWKQQIRAVHQADQHEGLHIYCIEIQQPIDQRWNSAISSQKLITSASR